MHLVGARQTAGLSREAHHDEVRLRRPDTQAIGTVGQAGRKLGRKIFERLRKPGALLAHRLDNRRELGAHLDDRLGNHLRHAVHRVRKAHGEHGIGHIVRADEIAYTSTCQGIRLRHGAQHAHVGQLRHERHATCLGVAELRIRLVHQHKRRGGLSQLAHEVDRCEVARGVVGRSDHNQGSPRVARGLEQTVFVQLKRVRVAVNVHNGRRGELGVELIGRKRRRAVHKDASLPAVCEQQVEKQLVSAIGHHDAMRRHVPHLPQKLAQTWACRLGIAVQRNARQAALGLARDIVGHAPVVLVCREHDAHRAHVRVVWLQVGQIGANRTGHGYSQSWSVASSAR